MKLLNINFELYYKFEFDEKYHSLSNEDDNEYVYVEPGWDIIIQVYSLDSFINEKSYLTSSNKPRIKNIRIEDKEFIEDKDKQIEKFKNWNLKQFRKIQTVRGNWINISSEYQKTKYVDKILEFLEEVEIIFRRWFKILNIDYQNELEIHLEKFGDLKEVHQSSIQKIKKKFNSNIKDLDIYGNKTKFAIICEEDFKNNYQGHINRSEYAQSIWNKALLANKKRKWKLKSLISLMENVSININ